MSNEFVDMMQAVQQRARAAALLRMAQGRPNEYMGNPGIINDLNKTPLTVLVGPGPEAAAAVKYALDRDADPNLPQYWTEHHDPSPSFPLELAFQSDCADQVRLLLDAKADVTRCSAPRMLQDCVKHGSMELVEVLLSLGVSSSELLGLVKRSWHVSRTWDANAVHILKALQAQVDWDKASLEYLEFRDWVLEHRIKELEFVVDKVEN
jgi:hypothetical protein